MGASSRITSIILALFAGVPVTLSTVRLHEGSALHALGHVDPEKP
jgi:hypothetical protein